jgi:hypothetical protein
VIAGGYHSERAERSVSPHGTLLGPRALAALCAIATVLTVSARVEPAHAASHPTSAGRCLPTKLNRSAVLPGTGLAVSPLPDSYDASARTQISLLGIAPRALSGVRVNGSSSGAHRGRLLAYSQGDGASFVPSRPFALGETVTVRGKLKGATSTPFAFGFVVARQNATAYSASARLPRNFNQMQHFASRPDLLAPALSVTARSPQSAPGLMFASPYAGPGPSGPMIFDEAGNLVWFAPLPRGTESTNLQVQQYGGGPVLSWWQGHITAQGFGQGEEMIYDSSYRQIGRVHAGNGYKADLHDFHITPQGTAVLTVFDPIACDLSSLRGPADGSLTDNILQEVDLGTGLVRREWHSADHVAPRDSYNSARGTSRQWPYDYFHLNSIDQLANQTTLLSARNTSALYQLDTLTGQVLARIGGKHSDVKLAPGAATAFQHDARVLPNGTISIFDNGATPKIHAQSRGMLVTLSAASRSEALLAQFVHPSPLSSASQGNLQLLANNDIFIGWGSEPYFSEFSAGGQLLFDAHMRGSYQSYRAYRFPWTGAPSAPPAVAAAKAGGAATVYASWNGDTRTASWRVLAGPSAGQLSIVAGAPRTGFETAIATPAHAAFVAVQALDASGAVLGTSSTIAG